MKDKKITIQDVALRAGVSKSTVSRVISDSPEISKATKDKIRGIMKELNYHPSAIARSLASNKSMNIGLVLPEDNNFFLNPFFQQSLRAISHKASENGYDVLIAYGGNEIQSIKRIIHANKVDGLILMRSRLGDSTIEYLRNKNIPYVLIGESLEYDDVYCVNNDNVSASYNITKKLIDFGCKHIGFIAGDYKSVVTIQRYEGYKKGIEEFLELDNNLIMEASFTVADGKRSMKHIFENNKVLDGIVITDDLMFLGALDYIHRYISKELIRNNRRLYVATFGCTKYDFVNVHSEYLHVINIDIDAVKLGIVSCEKLINLLQNKVLDKRDIVEYRIQEYGD